MGELLRTTGDFQIHFMAASCIDISESQSFIHIALKIKSKYFCDWVTYVCQWVNRELKCIQQ